jgi:cephalosporin-C deacetylase
MTVLKQLRRWAFTVLLVASWPAASEVALPGVRVLPVAAPGGSLSLTPDHADWTYAAGEPANVRVRFALDPYPAGGVPITYRLGPDMREGAERSAVVPAEGLLLAVPPQLRPGMVRCIVSARIDGKALASTATLAFSPLGIVATQTDPADFDTFWRKQKAALDTIAPDYVLTPAPEMSNADVDVSYLSFQNMGNWAGHSRFYGVLSVPRGAGPYPVVLSVPGAGVRGYAGERALAAKGFITLQVGIHGIPVNLPAPVYESLARGALAEYPRFQLDDREGYYYRRVYLGVLRAADYLAAHPRWDGRHFFTLGGSQGGQLAIMAAALDRRVTGVAASFPAYSDVSGYARGTTGGWPGLFRTGADGKLADAPVEAKLATTAYYDTVNFARRLRVPGFYYWGYNDTVTPPTSTFAAYNAIVAPKQLLIQPDQGHMAPAAQQARIDQWLLDQVRGATAAAGPLR